MSKASFCDCRRRILPSLVAAAVFDRRGDRMGGDTKGHISVSSAPNNLKFSVNISEILYYNI